MKKIFVSILIILLDFNLTASGYNVGLIPDFIGFWLLNETINNYVDKSIYFEKVHSLSGFMIFFSLVSYGLECSGTHLSNYGLLFIIQFFYTLLCLYVIYLVLLGLKDIEMTAKINLKITPTIRYFIIYASVTITIIIQLFIPNYMFLRYFATMITCPIFLIELYKSIKQYSLSTK